MTVSVYIRVNMFVKDKIYRVFPDRDFITEFVMEKMIFVNSKILIVTGSSLKACSTVI